MRRGSRSPETDRLEFRAPIGASASAALSRLHEDQPPRSRATACARRRPPALRTARTFATRAIEKPPARTCRLSRCLNTTTASSIGSQSGLPRRAPPRPGASDAVAWPPQEEHASGELSGTTSQSDCSRRRSDHAVKTGSGEQILCKTRFSPPHPFVMALSHRS